jgi:hypothetical protein
VVAVSVRLVYTRALFLSLRGAGMRGVLYCYG